MTMGLQDIVWITLQFMNYKKVKNTSILNNGYGLLPKILMFVTRLFVRIWKQSVQNKTSQ